MKKVAISLIHKGTVYTSDYNEMEEEELLQLKKFMEKVACGELSYLTFKTDNMNFYFSKKILKNSIIRLVYKN